MSPADQSSHEHQVGITNAQEQNSDAEIRRRTAEMNAFFAAKQYAEAAHIALSITAMNKDELRETFEKRGVKVLHLDHEAFGIYRVIEPSYDLRVDGATADVLAAATTFGIRHAQEAILIARKLQDGESDPAERLGLTITLHVVMTVIEAVRIAEAVQVQGFTGATFVPRRSEVFIYHTDDLGMTREQFEKAADLLVERLRAVYPQVSHVMQPYLLLMPKL
jgi:hypothetical protein